MSERERGMPQTEFVFRGSVVVDGRPSRVVPPRSCNAFNMMESCPQSDPSRKPSEGSSSQSPNQSLSIRVRVRE